MLCQQFTPHALAQSGNSTFIASVDKNTLVYGEDSSLILTLTLTGQKKSHETPNLEQSGIYESFIQQGSGRSERTQIINGVRSSQLEWQMRLAPRAPGILTIPAIQLGDLQSQPITIHVKEQSYSDSGRSVRSSHLVFIDITTDNNQVHIQQQILLKVKIFSRVSLYDDSSLTPLTIDNAIIKQVGETQKFEEVLQGIRHVVFELNFAIFPQVIGQLNIPSMTFTGTMATNDNSHFSSVFTSTGTPISASSNPLSISVTPTPDSWDTAIPWVPAKSLALSDQWSTNTDTLTVGDAITRTVTLAAEGLTASQLPTINTMNIANVKSYPDTIKTDDIATNSGILGNQVSAIALVPLQEGELTIPPLEIAWYDTQNNSIQTTTLPGKTFNVLPAVPTTQNIPNNAAHDCEDKNLLADDNNIKTNDSLSPTWKMIAGGFAVLWVLTILFFFMSQRKKKKPQDTENKDKKKNTALQKNIHNTPQTEPVAFKQLQTLCRAKNQEPQDITLLFKQWCRLLFKKPDIQSLEQCYRLINNQKITNYCEQINASRYSTQGSNLPVKPLFEACCEFRKHHLANNSTDSLTGLYPE